MDSLIIPALWVLSILLVAGGMVGTVYPALPGAPMMYGGLWLAAWLDHYHHVGMITLVILGALTGLSIFIDWMAGVMGAKRVGASPRAISGASLGTFIGMFFGPLGLVLGPFIGAVVGELSAKRTLQQATTAGVATFIGLLLGTLAKLALAFTMLGIFALAFLF